MEKSLLNLVEQEKIGRLVKLEKGQILFHEGEECHYIGIVKEGNISISSFTYNGNEIVYNNLSSGQVFGNNLIFSNEPIYRGSIIAKKYSKILIISKNELISLMQKNKEFLIKYQQVQSDFGKELNLKIKLLSIPNAEERFLYFLYINKNEISYTSITDLSTRLFMQRETLSRLISRLAKEQIISKNRNLIKKL